MNKVLWVIQVLLALHTLMGSIWKLSNDPAQSMPTLQAIPTVVWKGLSVAEVGAVAALIVPAFVPAAAIAAPIGAAFIAAEMVVFTVVHLSSGSPARGPIVYWLVVAAVCAFVIYGRLALVPIGPKTT